ncbi:hypothetical protein SASPL_107724 [Salvia splendens]|uniref:Serine-threonine/tyrosine-protein kinase catalytic domain-containing protein n=1 Tax=Salvia splendens TaxID=180675 RepID=A0A8X9A5K0_SALSN|nr:hypothetical protein SASPL_107724 [Salvia splendens]
MGLGNDAIKVDSLDVKISKGRKKKIVVDDDGAVKETGCCISLRFIGCCAASRSKVDSSVSSISTQEIKSTNGASRDQPVGAVIPSTTTSNAESSSSSSKLEEELKVNSRLRKFTFNDLKLATRNFRPESLLGEGGFGCVFKGWIEENGTAPVKPGTGLTVAVKTLNHDGLQGHKEWMVCFILNTFRLKPYAAFSLLYYLVTGLMKIALGAAKGLAFLHEEAERPVIYRDFKTSNILLDAVRHLTSKSDVYSFGVVLLEMLTGRRSMDKNRPNGEHNLVEWARPHLLERRRFYRLIDPRLEGHFSIKGAQKAAQLAAHCLSRDPKARPLMSEVVEALKPLPNLKDMATTSYFFQTMQADRSSPNPNSKNVFRTQGSFTKNGQQQPRSVSIRKGTHASPYHQNLAQNSPKPNGKA